jgi:hypothetical protein
MTEQENIRIESVLSEIKIAEDEVDAGETEIYDSEFFNNLLKESKL